VDVFFIMTMLIIIESNIDIDIHDKDSSALSGYGRYQLLPSKVSSMGHSKRPLLLSLDNP